MDGKRFLGTAQFLQANCTDEAAFRTVIGRAYYACYLAVRQVAYCSCEQCIRQKANIVKERDILHTPLQNYLKNSSRDEVKRLGQDLAGLQRSRAEADYDLNTSLSSEDSRQAIEEAQLILESLANIDHQSIGESMAEYLRKIYS